MALLVPRRAASELNMDQCVGHEKPDFLFVVKFEPLSKSGPNPRSF